MGINEFQSVGNKARSVVSQVKVDTGYSYKTELEQYRARKAELEAKQDEVERTITDDDGGETEKPSALDYITASLTGIAGVLSSAAPLFQGNGGSSDNAGGGSAGGASAANDPASKLDSAVAAFEAKPKSSQREAVVSAMSDARQALTTVDGEITDLENQNAQLAKGDYSKVMGDLRDGIKEAVNAEKAANTTIEDCNSQLNALSGKIVDNNAQTDKNTKAQDLNQKNQAEVKKLETETEVKIQTADGKILTVSQEKAGQYADLQKRETNASDIEKAIAYYNKEATEAATNLTQAENDLRAEEAKPKKIEKEVDDGKGGKKKVKEDNPDRSESTINKLKEDIKTYEKQKKENEKLEKDKIKEKEDNDKAIADLKGKIKIGDQTLAQLEETKAQAETDRDAAVAQKNELVTQFAGYIDEAATLKSKGVDLKDKETNVQSFGDETKSKLAEVIVAQEDLKELVNKDEAKATAAKQIETNNGKIKDLTDKKDKLESSINKANSSLAAHPDKADANNYEQGKEVMINGEKCTVLSCDENGLVVKDSKGKTHNVDLSSGKPVFSEFEKHDTPAGNTSAAAGGSPVGDKPAATDDKKTPPTVAEFKAHPDYSEFLANWKNNHEGKEPTDADIENWIKNNKDN